MILNIHGYGSSGKNNKYEFLAEEYKDQLLISPSFDYSKIAPNAPEDTDLVPRQPVIESASASTANQANDSNFAYILTGCVLGGLAVFTIAFLWLAFGAMQSAVTAPYMYDHMEESHTDSWDDYSSELEEFEDQLWDEYHSSHRNA